MVSFLKNNRPTVVPLLYGSDKKSIIEEIARSVEQGADGIGLMLETFPYELRNPKDITDFMEAMQGKPAYITNYRNGNKQTDEELEEDLLMVLSCGKNQKLIDVRTDMFDPTAGELTLNEKAIEKQIAFNQAIHRQGGEVLMSSHLYNRFIEADQVVFIAKEQQRRGADIAKIVTTANTEEELFENYAISLRLKNELDIPYLFLCNGDFCYKHRRLSAPLGSCMILTREDSYKNCAQPTNTEAIEFLKSLGYTDFDRKE